MPRLLALVGCFYLLLASFSIAADSLPGKIDYSRDIKPILSNNCYACHGPDEGKRQAGLRLDLREHVIKELESGTRAVVAGNPDQSELLARIGAEDQDLRMPPAESGKKLSARDKELLRRWIAEGASWGQHWSFVRPQRPQTPAVDMESWPRNSIDYFVLTQLERSRLKPSPEADRPTLLRRLSLDLTGLPPTPAQFDAFVDDTAPGAYERAVDELLSSPHYGERMALDWLDAARFADTNGYHIDNGRDMTHWREWVIDAFNRNLPFDRFTVEQLAGDLLPDATLEQRIASGFNRNHMINFEGGAIPEEYLVAYLVDRVNTTSTVWLGLTVGCAQCHDHKYDPITQKEFYQLYAYFHNVAETGLDGRAGNANPILKLATPEQQRRLDELSAQIKPLAAHVTDPDPKLDAAQAEWERIATGEESVRWTVLKPADLRSKSGAALSVGDDHSIRPGRAADLLTIAALSDLKDITALRLEVLLDDTVAGSSEAPAAAGPVQIQSLHITAGPLVDPAEIKSRGVRAASATDNPKHGEIAGAIDSDVKTAWKIVPAADKPRAAVFELDRPLQGSGVALLNVALELNTAEAMESSVSIRFSATASQYPHAGNNLPADVAKILATKARSRKPDQQARLREYFRGLLDPEVQQLAEQLKKLKTQYDELDKQIPSTMVMHELPQPRETFMLLRGQYDKLGQKVSAGVPAIFPPPPKETPANRLGLAQWLVDPANPLTARVIVNRYWQMYFGTGLVKTVEDFGSQGDWPTHPELLDWLAVEFIESGWDVKAMQRLIVTSATYRQSAAVTPQQWARDPENRLLARFPRVRLQAEFIRDQALAVSGLLSAKIGGPSVSPYQPAGLWDDLAYGQTFSAQKYQQSTGPDLYRRSMYTFWKRTVPPPTMLTFDAPDRETCTVRRARTNTPLQALVLLNDPTYIEASRKLAERIMTESGSSPDERIGFGFRAVLGRVPTAAETGVARKLYETQRAKFVQDAEATKKLLSVGESPRNEQLDAAELAAWTAVASALLNLDETVTKG